MATRPKTTRIADDTTQDVPQTTDAGDAPADTYDWKERASSAPADKGAAAEEGHLTVNAIEPVDPIVEPSPSGTRMEVYSAFNPDGSAVQRVRNYDTGASFPVVEWDATTAFTKGQYTVIGGKALEVTTAGTSDASTPTAPSAVGGTVTDGTVVWTRRS